MLEHPLLDEAAWVQFRDSGRRPLEESRLVTTYQSRVEFLVGAWIIDKIVPPRLGGSLLGNLQPQMLRVADVLAAELFENSVLKPRRSSKTTSIWCVLLGRCWMRPLYMAAYTMLTLAKKAEERFELDVRDPIIRKWRDKKTRPLKLQDGKGDKGIEFPNGSKLSILAPKGEDVRSGAYDMLVLDEGGEAEPDAWEDIVAAVIPSFDTRGDGAQLVLAGTGGKYRVGSYFWNALHDRESGRLRYGVQDDVDPALLERWETVSRIIEDIHPGLDGLTDMEKIKRNFDKLGWERFALEYCGHFGNETGNATAIHVATWQKTTLPGAPPVGVRSAALAVSVGKFSGTATFGVAWHLEEASDLADAAWELDGVEVDKPRRVGIKVLRTSRPDAAFERELLMTARKLKVPIVYDHGTATRALVERVAARTRPKPKLQPYQLVDVKVAHAQFLTALERGEIAHWAEEQSSLNKAAGVVVRESVGQGFLLRAPKGDDSADPTPIECLALAFAELPAMNTAPLNPGDVWDFGEDPQDTPRGLVA